MPGPSPGLALLALIPAPPTYPPQTPGPGIEAPPLPGHTQPLIHPAWSCHPGPSAPSPSAATLLLGPPIFVDL